MVKNVKKKKNKRTRLLPILIIQSIAAISVSLLSYTLMTYIVADVFSVENTYAAVGYESLGTLIIFIIVMVPINAVLYTKRNRELGILSDSIRKVADGDYSIRITYKPSDSMASIYEDFNKMCSELGSVQMLRNDFINSYSHEFRTPIASINGFASLLLEKEFPQEEERKYLKIIADESERLSHLSSNSILLSRLSSQQIIADAENYNLSEQIRQCSIMLSKAWTEKKIEFSVNLDDINIRASRELMQHVWLNILDNAIKYTPEGGEISVSAKKIKDKAQIEISDTGRGMDKDTLSHLFDPYYRGSSSSGLGLGLAIVKKIIDLSGGEIAVRSEEGIGTAFTITLENKVNQK